MQKFLDTQAKGDPVLTQDANMKEYDGQFAKAEYDNAAKMQNLVRQHVAAAIDPRPEAQQRPAPRNEGLTQEQLIAMGLEPPRPGMPQPSGGGSMPV